MAGPGWIGEGGVPLWEDRWAGLKDDDVEDGQWAADVMRLAATALLRDARRWRGPGRAAAV